MNSLKSRIVGLTFGVTSLLNEGCSTSKQAHTVHIVPQNSSPYPTNKSRTYDNSPKDNIREMEAEGWSRLTPQEQIIFKKRGELLKVCEEDPRVAECSQQEATNVAPFFVQNQL